MPTTLNTTGNKSEVWTADDVAQRLRCEKPTVLNLHRFRKLPGFRVGKSLRWLEADVERFLAARSEGNA